ncbi:MAG: tetratricopeptide repeat protein [Planctomycetes bacterium]|nr:tetratricopeptide repeat protein [Planctomycetota bacterium]
MKVSKATRYGFRPASWLFLAAGLLARAAWAQEVTFPSEDFKKLDTFEGHMVSNADKLFDQQQYRRAAAEYDSFLLEFPKSKALPYALLRKARCLHLDNKRFDALKEYQEVLDYFPDSVLYAAAALYYTGACHAENGDVEKAMKAWAEMAEDADYSKHFLAAGALNALAGNLSKQGRMQEAVQYYEQVAVGFRTTNPNAAFGALQALIPYYIRTQPAEPKLRELYQKLRSFESYVINIESDLEQSAPYWEKIRYFIRYYGGFNQFQQDAARQYYQYWASAMDGKLLGNDDFQIDLANFKKAYETDGTAQWIRRLDEQFNRTSDPSLLHRRVARWIQIFAGDRGNKDVRAKIDEYYAKCQFEKMSFRETFDLLQVLYDYVQDWGMAKNLFGKFRMNEISDSDKHQLGDYLWHKDEALVLETHAAMKDQDYANQRRLHYFHWRGDAARGVAVAEKLTSVPGYAKDAWWRMAELLERSYEWDKALTAFQHSDNPPESLFHIADCYVRLGKVTSAIEQLQEVEKFFQPRASEAALKIAEVYNQAGMARERIASLRGVMKKYPGSSHSNSAHEQLEALGVRIGGGEDAH